MLSLLIDFFIITSSILVYGWIIRREVVVDERRRSAESFATFLRLLDGLDDIRIREVLKREIEIYERKIND